MEEIHRAKYRGRGVQSFLALSGQASFPAHQCLQPRSSGISLLKSLYNPVCSPHPLPGAGEVELKVPTLWSCVWSFWWPVPSLKLLRGPTMSHFISVNSGVGRRGLLWITKGSPITQEIPRVLGALCWEPETQAKYISYCTTDMHARMDTSFLRSIESLSWNTCVSFLKPG